MHTADAFAALQYATIFCVADKTIPVRSNTPLASISTSYSMYSANVGVAVAETAMRIVTAWLPLLTIFKLAIVYVSAGAVYTVVFVAALISFAPNLPVAFFLSP
tara:strand:+ start:3041 stop:3352 length:312 start_codon:yes stop_codon:yes gene_type:complete